jgi:hypothetical protein
MPIRIASLSRQIQRNGQRLHLAIASRAFSHGEKGASSDAETSLREERQVLKEAQAKRRAQALLPKPKAVKVVKEAKPAKPRKAPKAAKPAKEAKEAKGAKTNKPSRADKQTKKAENLEAAKKADRKSAKT